MGKEELIVSSKPKSVFSESIKTFNTNLNFINNKNNMKVVLFTSPEVGDGKSFIVSNIAVAYAQREKKVLVIDCDLRKGRQHEIFGTANQIKKGFSNYILALEQGEYADKDNYIVNTDNKFIDLLARGPIPPNPVELLGSESAKKIIEDLKSSYDIILLDCPPVLGLSDTLMLTRYSDCNILVIKNKSTKTDILANAIKTFERVNSKITGIIINKATLNNKKYGSYYSNEKSKEN